MISTQPIILLASARSDGHSRMIAEELRRQLDIPTVLDFNNFQISYYDYLHRNAEDDFVKLIEKMIPYDHWILVSPVYWYSMSAQMKTFLDRITDLLKIRKPIGRQLRGKSLSIVACSSDQTPYPSFWTPFQLSADYLNMQYCEQLHTWIEDGQIPAKLLPAIDQFCRAIR